ncbi:unnamed protein product, partial [Discosporangium mesarthrocarpum]
EEPLVRRYFVGQWVDVKDTVNQWLEATVMGLSDTGAELNIHYNGWPAHWDEWLRWDSPRIAPFRTRTQHLPNARHVSPAPVSTVRNAPSTGDDDVRLFLPEVSRLLGSISPMVETVRAATPPPLWARVHHPHTHRPVYGTLPEEGKEEEKEGGGRDGGGSARPIGPGVAGPTRAKLSRAEVADLAADVAPLLDRLGRMLADVAPHVARLAEESPDATTAARGPEAGGGGSLRPLRGVWTQPPSGLFPPRVRPTSLGGGSGGGSRGRQVQRAAPQASSRSRSPSSPGMAFRRLVSTSNGGPAGNIDIHIHAIVPLRAPPSAGQGGGSSSLDSSSGAPGPGAGGVSEPGEPSPGAPLGLAAAGPSAAGQR